ncbi:MAG: SIMPL domain-containing protein [Acidimicrobiia bacterium]|nr:SIMPL domain-containing protein [Acidimicrobiia bacterium]NNF64120.1 SIMPL domain-containing protein [Acidimicrobiia bacterium]
MTKRTITVVGSGQAVGEPDVARADLGVRAVRRTVGEALERANQAAAEIIEACRTFEVAAVDVQTHRLMIQPQYDHRNGRNTVTGYEASNMVSVTCRDLGRLGELLAATVAAAGDDAVINGLQFSVDDPAELRAAAREAAWADAKSRAAQLAELANATLGSALAIDEVPSGGAVPRGKAVRMEAAFASDVPIEAGSESIAVTLTVTFSIG